MRRPTSNAMVRAYPSASGSFEDVAFNRSFLTACRGYWDSLPIHYPRATSDGQPGPPSPDGESFKWFVANERNGAAGTRYLTSQVIRDCPRSHASDEGRRRRGGLRDGERDPAGEPMGIARPSRHGIKYVVDGQVRGPQGETAPVRTIRIMDRGTAPAHISLSTRRRQEVIKEHDRVVLKSAAPAENLEAGDVGTVVHVYRDGLAYEVEFLTLDGRTAAVVTVEADQVRPVAPGEITHARRLAIGS